MIARLQELALSALILCWALFVVAGLLGLLHPSYVLDAQCSPDAGFTP